MTCNGQGICGCGRPECADAEWWLHFKSLWRSVAIAMDQQRNVEWSEAYE